MNETEMYLLRFCRREDGSQIGMYRTPAGGYLVMYAYAQGHMPKIIQMSRTEASELFELFESEELQREIINHFESDDFPD